MYGSMSRSKDNQLGDLPACSSPLVEVQSSMPWNNAAFASLQQALQPQDSSSDFLGPAEAAAYLASQHRLKGGSLGQLKPNFGTNTDCAPPKKRGRPSGSRSAARDGVDSDDKSTTVQEKNRAAQARFRERQKEKMTILESRVEELEVKNRHVTEEFRALESRKSVLEKVLSIKDEQIQQLQGHSVHPHDSSGCHDMHTLSLPASSAATSFDGALLGASEIVKIWTHYTSGLSELLAKVDSKKERSGFCVDIEKLATDALRWFQALTVSDPAAANLLLSTPLCEVLEHAALTPNHWENVVHALGVSDHQRQAILALTHEFKTELVSLSIAQRAELNELLMGSAPELDSSRLAAAQASRVAVTAAHLQGVLSKISQCHIEFTATILDRMLDKFQLAKAFVYSYPFFPDPLVISRLLDTPHCSGLR